MFDFKTDIVFYVYTYVNKLSDSVIWVIMWCNFY